MRCASVPVIWVLVVSRTCPAWEDEQPVGVFRQPMFDRGDGARLLWLQQPQRVGQDNNVFKERVARLGPGPQHGRVRRTESMGIFKGGLRLAHAP